MKNKIARIGMTFSVLLLTSAAASAGGDTCNGGRFDGSYIGANVGLLSSKSDTDERVLVGASLLNESRSGVSGGFQAGHNRQCGSALYGVEADINFGGIKSNRDYDLGGLLALPAPLLSDQRKIETYGTLRTRAGIVANDALLLYLTGGLAFAEIKHKLDVPIVPFNVFDESKLRWGWTVGAGAEMALTNRLSLKSEALFMQFQNQDYGVAQLPTVRFTDRDQAWVTRIGLNYKFGGRDAAEPAPMK